MSLHFMSRAWASVVGPCIAGVTRVEESCDGILWVAVDSPAWAEELEAMAPKIIDGFRQRRIDVQEIRWVGLAPRLVPTA